jgi:hypothetical protein
VRKFRQRNIACVRALCSGLPRVSREPDGTVFARDQS